MSGPLVTFIDQLLLCLFRDATGTVQKSRKVSGDRGSGGRAPSGVQGQRPGGGSRPLEARAFSQSELPRKPPIDTHGRYTYNTCMGGKGKKKGGGGKINKKSEGLKKSEKRHPCLLQRSRSQHSSKIFTKIKRRVKVLLLLNRNSHTQGSICVPPSLI